MAKKTTNKTQEQDQKQEKHIKFSLSNGTKVELRQGKGIDAIRARKNAPDSDSVGAYLIAQLGTFDGKKMPAEEILNLNISDYLLLEGRMEEVLDTKNFQQQEM